MKKLSITTFSAYCLPIVFGMLSAFAQAPEKINYQGVARNNKGEILPDQTIGLKITLHSATTNGPVVYQEIHSAITSPLGLFTIEIGGGRALGASDFSSINWGADAYFVQTEMDIAGGSNYLNMGTQQLLSVPYALYAKTSGNGITKPAAILKEYGTDTSGVWIPFSDEFASALNGNTPFVLITPLACNEGFYISELSSKGFMINKSTHVLTKEVFKFNWQAEVPQIWSEQ